MGSRWPVHFAVTANPTAEWAARQLLEAFPRDTAPKSPWQNPYVERLIGSIRRECLDHVIVWNETGLHRILKSYFEYYERTRTHLSLEKDTPIPPAGYSLRNSERWWSCREGADSIIDMNAARPSLPGSALSKPELDGEELGNQSS